MIIEIERLTPEPLHIERVYGVRDLSFRHDDAVLEEPVAADFVLTHKGQDLHVTGAVTTAIRYQCSRCLKEFTQPLHAGFDLFYLPQAVWKQDQEIELKYEDMEVGYYDGINLDVDLMILEQIELAMPMKFICHEDCKGLCPSCGKDRNEGLCHCRTGDVDSRLSVLRDFRKKMKE